MRAPRPATAGCRCSRPSCPTCWRSAVPSAPARTRWRATRAPAAPCCAWPRSWRRRGHEPAHPGHGRAGGGGAGQRPRRGLGPAPAPPGLHRPEQPGARARRAEHRVRPPAAGAGHLVGSPPHRAGGRHPAGHALPHRCRPRGAAAKPLRARPYGPRQRLMAVGAVLAVSCAVLLGRAAWLQLVEQDFYQQQGDARFLREIPIPTSRGMITDRNGEPLAISSPVESVWANPKELLQHPERLPELAKALDIPRDTLEQRIAQRADKEFVYLRRHMNPDIAEAVVGLGIPGVYSQREFRRFYPHGEVMAHVLGFTNIDDKGQEGLELAFDDWLSGKPGSQRVIRDRRGRIVEYVDLVRPAEPGSDLTLSI